MLALDGGLERGGVGEMGIGRRPSGATSFVAGIRTSPLQLSPPRPTGRFSCEGATTLGAAGRILNTNPLGVPGPRAALGGPTVKDRVPPRGL
jgi:hypothetical protein